MRPPASCWPMTPTRRFARRAATTARGDSPDAAAWSFPRPPALGLRREPPRHRGRVPARRGHRWGSSERCRRHARRLRRRTGDVAWPGGGRPPGRARPAQVAPDAARSAPESRQVAGASPATPVDAAPSRTRWGHCGRPRPLADAAARAGRRRSSATAPQWGMPVELPRHDPAGARDRRGRPPGPRPHRGPRPRSRPRRDRPTRPGRIRTRPGATRASRSHRLPDRHRLARPGRIRTRSRATAHLGDARRPGRRRRPPAFSGADGGPRSSTAPCTGSPVDRDARPGSGRVTAGAARLGAGPRVYRHDRGHRRPAGSTCPRRQREPASCPGGRAAGLALLPRSPRAGAPTGCGTGSAAGTAPRRADGGAR